MCRSKVNDEYATPSLHPVFWNIDSLGSSLIGQIDSCPGSYWGSACLCIPRASITDVCCHASFYVGSKDLSLGLQSYTISDLPTELLPQPLFEHFTWRSNSVITGPSEIFPGAKLQSWSEKENFEMRGIK